MTGGREIAAQISMYSGPGEPAILILMNRETLSPQSLWVTLMMAQMMVEKGDLGPDRSFVVPVLPPMRAVRERVKGSAGILGRLRGGRTTHLENVGIGRWARAESFDQLLSK